MVVMAVVVVTVRISIQYELLPYLPSDTVQCIVRSNRITNQLDTPSRISICSCFWRYACNARTPKLDYPWW